MESIFQSSVSFFIGFVLGFLLGIVITFCVIGLFNLAKISDGPNEG